MGLKTHTAIATAALALVHFGLIGEATGQARMNAGLAHMLGSFRLRVVHGRIAVAGAASFQTHKGEFKTTDRHERLELTQAGPSTTFHYELTTPKAQLTWDLLSANEIRIRSLPRGDTAGATDSPRAKLVTFSQPTEGPLSLVVGEGDARRETRGATLWHLFLAEPELCRTELTPLLQVMRPGWDLVQRAQTAEALLLGSADAARQGSRAEWLELVAQLGHAKFVQRQAADRRLRLAGADALPFLLSLDTEHLDAEQRFRVRAIVRTLVFKENGDLAPDDAPDQIVRSMIDDPSVWCDLLARDYLEIRQIASERLKRLLDETIDFDIGAERAVRQGQIRELRQRIHSQQHHAP